MQQFILYKTHAIIQIRNIKLLSTALFLSILTSGTPSPSHLVSGASVIGRVINEEKNRQSRSQTITDHRYRNEQTEETFVVCVLVPIAQIFIDEKCEVNR